MKKHNHFIHSFFSCHFLAVVLCAVFILPAFAQTSAEQIPAYKKTVVTILSYYNDEQGQVLRNQGTGICISKDLVMTVAHVVSKAEAIFIRSEDGNLTRARFYKVSPAFDIAILQVEKPFSFHQTAFKPLHLALPKMPLTAVHYGGSYHQISTNVSIVNEMDIRPLSSLYVLNFKLQKGSSGGGIFFSDGSLAGVVIGSNGRQDQRAIALSSSAVSILVDDLEDILYNDLEKKQGPDDNCMIKPENDQEYTHLLATIKANYWNGSSPVLQDAVTAFLDRYPDVPAANILSAMIAVKQGKALEGYTSLVSFANQSACPYVNFYLGKICAEKLGYKEEARVHYKKAMQQASNPLFISLLRQRIRLLTHTFSGE